MNRLQIVFGAAALQLIIYFVLMFIAKWLRDKIEEVRDKHFWERVLAWVRALIDAVFVLCDPFDPITILNGFRSFFRTRDKLMEIEDAIGTEAFHFFKWLRIVSLTMNILLITTIVTIVTGIIFIII